MEQSDQHEHPESDVAPISAWKSSPESKESPADLIWEPLTTEPNNSAPEGLVWNEPDNPPEPGAEHATNEQKDSSEQEQTELSHGLRWPNGQIMSKEDQIYFRSAYSRGNLIQIGDTTYPFLGFNALQRHPRSFIDASIIAIDDSRIGRTDCKTGDFLDECADAFLEVSFRLINEPEWFSLDGKWTMHSLSGEGAPFNFQVGDQTYGDSDTGTKFGEGQSLGFRLSKNLGKTWGVSLIGDRLYHLDDTTDLTRSFSLITTKVIRLKDNFSPPILSLSAGLATDVYNPETNIGTLAYPSWLRGGLYSSGFAEKIGKPRTKEQGYDEVAGVTSAFVCAHQTVFKPFFGEEYKSFEQADPNCIKEVYIGPVASIGFAPWPWIGIYTMYTGTNLNMGVSLKPFKDIPWSISLEYVDAIKGINPIIDATYDLKECKDKTNSSFSDCRTRVGLYTTLAF